jgi:tetratricopeptide (TPR) repeat protein
LFGFGSQDKKRGWDAALNAANDARDAEQWLQAAASYEMALSFDGQRGDIWVQFGHSLKEFGAFGEAVKAYRQAIKLNPGVAEVHVHLAHVLKRIGSYSAAKAEFERAVALDPSDVESASELDMLEDKAKAEAVKPADAEQLVEVEEPGHEDSHRPIFREFEVTASHFAQEGAIKALNKKLQADIDLLTQQNEGLQKELLKQSAPAKVSRSKPTTSKSNGAASAKATGRQRQGAE